MSQEKTKDVSIGDHQYRVGKLTARTASWVAMQILTKLLPSGDELVTGGRASAERSALSESEFHNIQGHCLRVCARYETAGESLVPTPVLMADGRFAIPELEYDVVAVMALTLHSLMFSVSPFFEEGALKLLGSSLPDLRMFNASR
jgi:Phage tail assembly chaperone protein, TAC